MKILTYIKIIKNTKIYKKKMPIICQKENSPKFAKFPKVSKTKIFPKTGNFAKISTNMSKIKSIWQFYFSRNFSFAKLSVEVSKIKSIFQKLSILQNVLKNVKNKNVLKNCQISEHSSQPHARTVQKQLENLNFWLDWKPSFHIPKSIISNPNVLENP